MKPIERKLNYSGIYCIINILNNKKYIGSSKNIKIRLQTHRAELRHNHHDNTHLQNAWNKYGENHFEYYIIEPCDESILLEREQYYIDTIKPEYNINTLTTKPPISEESKKKISETRKLKISKGEIPITHNKYVYQYDLDGNFIMEFPSIRQAARYNNIHPSQIHACLRGKYKRSKEFQWSYIKKEKLDSYKRNNTKPFRKKSYCL